MCTGGEEDEARRCGRLHGRREKERKIKQEDQTRRSNKKMRKNTLKDEDEEEDETKRCGGMCNGRRGKENEIRRRGEGRGRGRGTIQVVEPRS